MIIMEMVICMMGNIHKLLWRESMSTDIYTLNMCPTKAVEDKTPCEI